MLQLSKETWQKENTDNEFCFRYGLIPLIFIPKIMIKIKHEEETTGTRTTFNEEMGT